MSDAPKWGRQGREDDHFAFRLSQPQPWGLGDRVRFDHSKQQWHIWNGTVWAPDRIGYIYELMRDCFNEWTSKDGVTADDIKILASLLNSSKKESVLKALATVPGIAMKGDEWDPNPTLLAFEEGVLDLRTRKLLAAAPEMLLSRSTGVKWDPDAKCPKFEQFLDEITGGDVDLVRYLLRILGYAMFGWQREQKFWMWVGQGQNGKGTLAKVFARAMGSYADAPSDTLYMKTRFGAARSDTARPDLLRLQGLRWTYMSEPLGGQFNEEMLKSHTGDDPIQARDLYAKAASFSTFRPSHTIVFLTNNPPRTEDVGVSMQRRVRVIWFTEDFSGAKDNKNLEDELVAEAPGILALLSRFAKERFSTGQYQTFEEPEKVKAWSREYIEDNDPMGQFILESCVLGRELKTPTSLLYAAYQDWCIRNNTDQGSQTGFGLALARKFKRIKTMKNYMYIGIRPKNAMELAEGDTE